MNEIIDFIEQLKLRLKFEQPDSSDISKLIILKNLALYLSENENTGTIDKIIPLTDQGCGYSEYRIMNDGESDDRACWYEYKYDNQVVRLDCGDIFIKMK